MSRLFNLNKNLTFCSLLNIILSHMKMINPKTYFSYFLETFITFLDYKLCVASYSNGLN